MSNPMEPEAAAPVPAPVPAPAPARGIDAGVFVGLGLVVVGFVLALIPLWGVIGWPLMLAGLILGIIGAAKKWNPMWGSIVNIVLGFVGPGLAFVLVLTGVFAAAAPAAKDALDEALEDAPPATTQEVPAEDPEIEPEDAEPGAEVPSFVDGVLVTDDMRIEITKHKVVPAGGKGNEYGDEAVIAFWYEITNVSGEDLQAYSGFVFSMSVFQDNDPDAENELDSAILFDLESDKRHQNIKKGGTVKNVIAFTLTDETTPVTLVAQDGLFGGEIGRIDYRLK
ncbi:DUF5067 domain-containing protein [Leucobacter soli]|uniref:DUF5067 domain-containing protein n=1 Tax=Leucobacter soli TaxID=2812850 RepID=A0A916NPC3_9MICO|nr:DUF5067 domain-containing protein [Leucobacter soli]CAG7613526.1 hypothetical protein LEUCIP111803_01706 [Leucobacter soli]